MMASVGSAREVSARSAGRDGIDRESRVVGKKNQVPSKDDSEEKLLSIQQPLQDQVLSIERHQTPSYKRINVKFRSD